MSKKYLPANELFERTNPHTIYITISVVLTRAEPVSQLSDLRGQDPSLISEF